VALDVHLLSALILDYPSDDSFDRKMIEELH
jgi:hypothetical protein